jgi:predicted metal-dependent hydrolase
VARRDRLIAGAPEIAYSVRRSARAKHVHVRVDGERGVEVVLPTRASERAAARAVAELRPWVERRLAELAAQRVQREGWLPYLDDRLTLISETARTRVHRHGATLLVPPNPQAALERWYRNAARAEIAPRLDRATAIAGCSYKRLMIRNQRTRWASYSANGTMSFNWRLLLAPEYVLDYVVWHEVCHIEVADHSRRFWDLLASRLPEYRGGAEWLRRNSAQLVL